MSYVLQHTAKAIDNKLNLIDKNKNLLPYPYTSDFPEGFSVREDGSILVSAGTELPIINPDTGEDPLDVTLNTISLSAGKKYVVSIEVVNLANESVTNPGFNLVLLDDDDQGNYTKSDITDFATLDLSTATTDINFTIHLYSHELSNPITIVLDLVLKLQIEEVQVDLDGNEILEKTSWVPYMKTIGAYVDWRFNNTNAKIKVLDNKLDELGSKIEDSPSSSTGLSIETDSIVLSTDAWRVAGTEYSETYNFIYPTGISYYIDLDSESLENYNIIFDISSDATLAQRKAAENACLYGFLKDCEDNSRGGNIWRYEFHIGITADTAPTENIPLKVMVIK